MSGLFCWCSFRWVVFVHISTKNNKKINKSINSAFVVDHDRAVNKLKQDLQRAILKIQRLDTEDKIGLARQLEKLGDIESNVSSSLEGIVFKAPNGRTYKITGAFAMVNQIINKAMRLKEPNQVSESKIRRIIRETIIASTILWIT